MHSVHSLLELPASSTHTHNLALLCPELNHKRPFVLCTVAQVVSVGVATSQLSTLTGALQQLALAIVALDGSELHALVKVRQEGY